MGNLVMDKPVNIKTEDNVKHIPVMFNEIIDYLNIRQSNIIVDGTIGLGGHSLGIVKRLGPKGRLIGIDRDGESLSIAKRNLQEFSTQCNLIHGDFRNIDIILEELNIDFVDGILLDLGVSSLQLENPERGFSIRADGPLDMRMDQCSYITAYDLINSLSEKEIATILKDFGQERWCYRIARKIVNQRVKNPIGTTKELRKIVLSSIPYRRKKGRIHPATRTFQAIRIAVNRELEALELAIDKCINLLNSGGRIAIIAFHSLEDKIVKEKFKQFLKSKEINLLVEKPLRPNDSEIKNNPRARSARLRIAERI